MKPTFDINNPEEDELKNSFPNLSKISKENPFMVPEDYFESLPAMIQEKCVKPASGLRNKIYVKVLKPQYFIIASLVLVLTGFMLYKSIKQFETNRSISRNENYTEEYLLNIENIDENQIAEVLSEEKSTLKSDDIIDYLSDDDSNNNDLINNKTMKSKIAFRLSSVLIAFFVITTSSSVFAQHENFQKKRQEINAEKIAYITKELNLTPQEAQVFWPVYNEYENKMEGEMKAFRDEKKSIDYDKISDKEATALADQQIIQMQKMLDVKKAYHAKFKEVLPPKKLLKLYDAEKGFRRQLLKQIHQNRKGGE